MGKPSKKPGIDPSNSFGVDSSPSRLGSTPMQRSQRAMMLAREGKLKWTPEAMTGLYVSLWGTHYRPTAFSRVILESMTFDFRKLAKRVGEKEVVKAIHVVFEQLKWAENKQSILFSETNYNRFIVPKLTNGGSSHSEWTNDREQKGYKRVKI